jgi:hypothetical protein
MKLTAVIEREGDGYVSLCPELDVASQGKTTRQLLARDRGAVAQARSLAQAMCGWTRPRRPQSVPAMTFSWPTISVNVMRRSATSSECSTRSVACLTIKKGLLISFRFPLFSFLIYGFSGYNPKSPLSRASSAVMFAGPRFLDSPSRCVISTRTSKSLASRSRAFRFLQETGRADV